MSCAVYDTLCMLCSVIYRPTDSLAATLQLQIAGGYQDKAWRVLKIDIEFTPSLALYIWQSLRKGLWQAVQQWDDVKEIWMNAAEICSTQGCIAASISQSATFLPALLAVDPLQTFPVNRLLYMNTSESQDPFILPQVEPLLRSVLLFAQLLTAVAADHKAIQSRHTHTTHAMAQRAAIASTLTQLTDISSCVPVLLTDLTPQVQTSASQAASKPSKFVSMWRSAVLVSKLATLTFNVKADLLGHADPEMPMAVQALWRTMGYIASYIHEAITMSGIGFGAHSDRQDSEEQALAALLCEHLVAILRQVLKESRAAMQRDCCLTLLSTALGVMSPEALRHEVKRLGKKCIA